MAWQLRKPADGDRKYLFERERVNLEKQSLTQLRRILRANADELLNKEPEKEDGAQGKFTNRIENRNMYDKCPKSVQYSDT